MMAACPQCAAPIEFRFDDSFVRVCGHCRAAVARTDRGLETLGKVADLTPFDSPLALFAEGTYAGQSFILVGKAQISHAAGGLWQEWYAKFSGGLWGWLAEAQGRYYMTFETPNLPAPPHYQMQPGGQLPLPTHGGPRTFSISEVGVATYVSADGELPYRLVPGSRFRYADLSDGQGNFASVDYGSPEAGASANAEPPSIYIGAQIRLQDLNLHGGETGPPPQLAGPTISSQRLACPNCNGSLELLAPGASLRIVCPYCSAVLDISANTPLKLIMKLAEKARPVIKLGSKGKFPEGEMTVIGFMERSALVDGTWYPFGEYLLHSPALGFRWLVCSDGHWSYAQPIAPGACSTMGQGREMVASYRDVDFKHFQDAKLRVNRVVGEFYWRVTAGEQSFGSDFVNPPAMLSREAGSGEVNWTLSTYLPTRQLKAMLGQDIDSAEVGVAPNQPWRHVGVGKYYVLLCAALLGLAILFGATTKERGIAAFSFDVPAGKAPVVVAAAETPTTPTEGGHVHFSEPFELRAGQNIDLSFHAPLNNNWLYYVVDLVEEEQGGFLTFDGNLERYSGYDSDGTSWSEGSNSKSQTLGPVRAGTYVLRIEALQGGTTALAPEVALNVTVRQNVFQFFPVLVAFGILLVPGLLLWIGARSFEAKRWSNSAYGAEDDDDGDD
jgi:Domain of unknown function (DUF4178)